MHYLNVERVDSTTIYERYIEDGVEKQRFEKYQPSLFSYTQDINTKYKDIYGKPCVKKTFSAMWEADRWKRTMRDSNLEVLGLDDYILTYIGDHYEGELKYNLDHIRVGVTDIEVTGETFPKPEEAIYPIDAITHYDSIQGKFFVFDLLEGGLDKWDQSKSILRKETLDKVSYSSYDTEVELIEAFTTFIENNPPVIWSGWNNEGFDIPYIINRTVNIGLQASRYSPVGKLKQREINTMYGQKIIHNVVGVSIIDYMDLYRTFGYTPLPSYSLDAAAKADGLEGKITYNGPINKLRSGNYIPSKIKSKESYDLYNDNLSLYSLCKSILHEKLTAITSDFEKDTAGIETYRIPDDNLLVACERVVIDQNNLSKAIQLYHIVSEKHKQESHQRYIDYNISDVEIIMDLDYGRRFFELVISMSYHAKVPFDAVFSPLKTWDGILYNSLRETNEIVPPIKHTQKIPFPGAFVMEPELGKGKKYTISFDFTSLYPRIIEQVNISPEKIRGSFPVHNLVDYINKIAPRPSDEFSCSPNGMMYCKESKGIIPREVGKIFRQRKQKQKIMHAANRNIEVINRLLEAK